MFNVHSFRLFFPILIIHTCLSGFSGNNYPIGASSSAIGHATVAYSDLWSTHHNQAGLGWLTNAQIGSYYESRFLLKELGVNAGALALPTQYGTMGCVFSSYGIEQFKETRLKIAYGKAFGNIVSAGIGLNYLSLRTSEYYGKQNAVFAEAGIQTKINSSFILGFHIFNPTRSMISKKNNEYLPTILRTGITYIISEKLLICAEAEKNIRYPVRIKSGIQYVPKKEICLRAGISTNPSIVSFGFSTVIGKLSIDITSSFHQVLGFSPSASLMYKFREKKNHKNISGD